MPTPVFNKDYIKQFPSGLDELSRFDVVFLGDVGVDDGQRQILEGVNLPHTWTQVAVQLEDQEVVVLAAQELQAWQELARFPRSEFAGDPVSVRLGKMSPGSRNEDFSTLGPAGVCAIQNFRVLGK